MTYSGNFDTNRSTTVSIPSILHGINQSSLNSYNLNVPLQYCYDNNGNVYFIQNNNIFTSKFGGILNSSTQGYSLINDSTTGVISSVYPNSINGYFYSFSIASAFAGGASAPIFRASVKNPTVWISAGSSGGNNFPGVYVDSNNIYLLGGNNNLSPTNASSVSSSAIYRASVSNPLSFSNVGNLPAVKDSSTVFKVGSTIYVIGGYASSVKSNTIFTANTSNPLSWTVSGSVLPTLGGFCDVYNDGNYIYLFNEGTTSIYRAPVSSPTNFTLYTTLASGSANMAYPRVVVDTVAGYLYLFDSYVQKASLSDLSTWSIVSGNLATAVRSTHILKDSDKIYALGGFTTGSSTTNVIQSAPVNNPVDWKNETTSLLDAIGGGELVITSGYYNIIGGNGNTGYVYTASVGSPTSWTRTSGGPPYTRGKACIVGGFLFYLGGESGGTPTNKIYRCSIDSGNSDYISNDWRTAVSGGWTTSLPIALSRFALVRSGAYLYLIGGITSSSTMNAAIYRTNVANLVRVSSSTRGSYWVQVGNLNSPMVDPSVVIVNNYVYIVGGGPDGNFNSTNNGIAYASMSDLANGQAIFTEESTATSGLDNISTQRVSFAESKSFISNDHVFFFGGRSNSSTDANDSIYKTTFSSTHILTNPKTNQGIHPIPTIDKYGAIGSYSTFQRTGYLPWLVYDSSNSIR